MCAIWLTLFSKTYSIISQSMKQEQKYYRNNYCNINFEFSQYLRFWQSGYE